MKLALIAKAIGSTVDPAAANRDIARISSLDSAGPDSVSFVVGTSHDREANRCGAAAVIVQRGRHIDGKVNLEVDDPYLGYAKVAALFEDRTPLFEPQVHPSVIVDPSAGLHPSVRIGPATVIGPGVTVGARTTISAGCIIEKDSRIGEDCRIDSGVIIRYGSRIGSRVIIQAGTVVGSDGFANAVEKGTFVRIPCFGCVVIEDDVEIGACVTIDRGNFEPTVIRTGARLDNLIQVAHNVVVGKHTAMAAQVGISGSTRIGDHVLVGGQAGFVGHLEIGDGAFIGAQAGVSKNVPPGAKVAGYPARDLMKTRRIEAAQQELPALLKEVKGLRARLDELEKGLTAKG